MKRTWKKWIALSLAIGIFCIGTPAIIHAEEAEDNTPISLKTNETTIDLYSSQYGTWMQSNGRYWFRNEDGTFARDGIYIMVGFNQEVHGTTLMKKMVTCMPILLIGLVMVAINSEQMVQW